jgi:hypothetical protein
MPERRHLVRIVADGEGPDDIVISLIDGPVIDKVRRLVFHAAANEASTVELEIWMPTVMLQGYVNDVLFTCQVCGKDQHHKCDDD